MNQMEDHLHLHAKNPLQQAIVNPAATDLVSHSVAREMIKNLFLHAKEPLMDHVHRVMIVLKENLVASHKGLKGRMAPVHQAMAVLKENLVVSREAVKSLLAPALQAMTVLKENLVVSREAIKSLMAPAHQAMTAMKENLAVSQQVPESLTTVKRKDLFLTDLQQASTAKEVLAIKAADQNDLIQADRKDQKVMHHHLAIVRNVR
jgi:hypothetical protein